MCQKLPSPSVLSERKKILQSIQAPLHRLPVRGRLLKHVRTDSKHFVLGCHVSGTFDAFLNLQRFCDAEKKWNMCRCHYLEEEVLTSLMQWESTGVSALSVCVGVRRVIYKPPAFFCEQKIAYIWEQCFSFTCLANYTAQGPQCQCRQSGQSSAQI